MKKQETGDALCNMLREELVYTVVHIMHTEEVNWSGMANLVVDHIYRGHTTIISTRPISFDQERKIKKILEGD